MQKSLKFVTPFNISNEATWVITTFDFKLEFSSELYRFTKCYSPVIAGTHSVCVFSQLQLNLKACRFVLLLLLEYSWLPVTRTLENSKFTLTRTNFPWIWSIYKPANNSLSSDKCPVNFGFWLVKARFGLTKWPVECDS